MIESQQNKNVERIKKLLNESEYYSIDDEQAIELELALMPSLQGNKFLDDWSNDQLFDILAAMIDYSKYEKRRAAFLIRNLFFEMYANSSHTYESLKQCYKRVSLVLTNSLLPFGRESAIEKEIRD